MTWNLAQSLTLCQSLLILGSKGQGVKDRGLTVRNFGISCHFTLSYLSPSLTSTLSSPHSPSVSVFDCSIISSHVTFIGFMSFPTVSLHVFLFSSSPLVSTTVCLFSSSIPLHPLRMSKPSESILFDCRPLKQHVTSASSDIFVSYFVSPWYVQQSSETDSCDGILLGASCLLQLLATFLHHTGWYPVSRNQQVRLDWESWTSLSPDTVQSFEGWICFVYTYFNFLITAARLSHSTTKRAKFLNTFKLSLTFNRRVSLVAPIFINFVFSIFYFNSDCFSTISYCICYGM